MLGNTIIFLVVVNVLVIGFGGLLAYSDLNVRTYDVKSHLNTQVVSVEYGVLSYSPTYQYYDKVLEQVIVTQGSWTLDYVQVAILVMAIVDIRCIYVNRQKI